VKDLTHRYGISCDTLTRMTGFSLRAVSNWSQGSKPSSSTARRLTEIKRLFAALEELVSPEAIGPWLKEPNTAFDGSTPLQVIERGETDRIWRMVYELESGEPA
jgi:predicted transcriptional regulator